jgi:hypothetical protein
VRSEKWRYMRLRAEPESSSPPSPMLAPTTSKVAFTALSKWGGGGGGAGGGGGGGGHRNIDDAPPRRVDREASWTRDGFIRDNIKETSAWF